MKYCYLLFFLFTIHSGVSQSLDVKYDLGGLLLKYHEIGLDLTIGDKKGVNFGFSFGQDYRDYEELTFDSLLMTNSTKTPITQYYSELDLAWFLRNNDKTHFYRSGIVSRYKWGTEKIGMIPEETIILDSQWLLGLSLGLKKYFLRSRSVFLGLEVSSALDVLSETRSTSSFINFNLGYRIF